jgi:hypothetical protein
MLAAALTLWAMFSAWLLASTLRLPAAIGATAATLGVTELLALLAWSYGTESCAGAVCAPLAQALGVAARTDIPILTALFIVVMGVRMRSAGGAAQRFGERAGERMGADGRQEEISDPERRIHDSGRGDAR